jgi:hypothetical protein
MRKRVNKYLPENLRELGMWSISLLVNTSTWPEMKENWRLICHVFLNYATNNDMNFKQYHATLLSHIGKITGDPNSSKAISQSKQVLSSTTDPFEFDDDNDFDDNENNQLHADKNVKASRKTKQSINKNRSVSRKKLYLHIYLA